MVKKVLNINGMHCNSCERLIEDGLKEKDGVYKVSASYVREVVAIEFDSEKISESEIKNELNKLGYDVIDNKNEEVELDFQFERPSNSIGGGDSGQVVMPTPVACS